MLSAHQPFERYPAILKKAVLQAGGVAQFAGGVPAMCDGITQGRAGMELSLFSRDVVAMSTAVALSHDMFDGALMLGVCDKIVPGLLIGALSFGHLPTVFVPAGPMPSGLPERREEPHPPAATRRARSAARSCSRPSSDSYHSPGTCTFYGTANSNQLVVEAMGLHLPGRELRQPRHAAAPRADRRGRPRRDRRAARRSARSSTSARWSTASSRCWPPAARPTTRCTSSRSRPPPGCTLTWDDFADLSAVVAAARPRLPQRPGRHQPLPRRGRRRRS